MEIAVTTPFFKDATPGVTWTMRLFVGANVALVVFCASYLVVCFPTSGLGWPMLIAAVLAGYVLADFFSGVVHWAMDTWFDERTLGRAIAIAREHHTHPHHIHGYGFLEYASLGSTPSALFIGPIAGITALFPSSATTCALMMIWLVNALCMLFGTSFHNLAHRPARSAIMRLAQRIHLVCPPAHHWVHHRNQTIHYCVVNGWANYVCDGLGVWRALERLIGMVTGLVPRADDLEWQRHYRETGKLADPRRAP
jgi:ubiquitin-conjugating enzyme E2 variant